MGVTKTTHSEGSGAIPKPGQTVTIEYTGYLKDTSKPEQKGSKYASCMTPYPACFFLICGGSCASRRQQSANEYVNGRFDSSVGRGDFVTRIGVGQVIKGWDEGVTQMKVGEKATLDITSDYAYGER
ncbi:FK506-binding protein 1B [Colletotrichum liriopes]|uniref:peptidylprolyl isomerase n=1 Tax=Colletotrichum liriopes TaxID=708192 RepID=A0AA37LMV2_9PEZI|nr:FK506-binding protein 1B [Colletotrichum liriopes]